MEKTKSAYLSALKLLGKRPYSLHKLQLKLKEKNFDNQEINEAINQLKSEGLYREEEYTLARIKGLIRKSYPPHLIQQRLAEENISLPLLEIIQIFEENQILGENQIENLLSKKELSTQRDLSKKGRFATSQKLLRYIMNKGHDAQLAIVKINHFLDQLDKENDMIP